MRLMLLIIRQLSRLVLCVALIVMLGCREADPSYLKAGKHEEMPQIVAETLTVELLNWPTVVRCQGSLLPDEQAVIGAKIGGRVDTVHIEIGDYVEQGAPLATLDQEEARLRVLQAEAQLRQARSTVGLVEGQSADDLDPKNAPPVREAKAKWDEGIAAFKRARMLKTRDAMSAAEFDQAAAVEQVAQAQYTSSLNSVAESLASIGVRQAELLIAKQQLADAVVKAPFAGYIQQREIAPGAYVATGQTIAILVRTTPLRFRGAVPERFAQSLKPGQEVRLTIQSVPMPVVASVTRISPMLDPRSRTLMFEAEVANDDQRLRTGLFAEAEVVIDPNASAIILPESAIVEFAGNQKVWKVVDGITSEQSVATSDRRNGFREVVEGLTIGDRILVDGERGLVAKLISPGSSSALTTASVVPMEHESNDAAALNAAKEIKQPVPVKSPEHPVDRSSSVSESS